MHATRLRGIERERMAEVLASRGIHVGNLDITVTPLPFYPGAHLFKIGKPGRSTSFVLLDNIEKGAYIPADFIAEVLQISATHRLLLNEETVLDYLRFYTDIMSLACDGDFHILGHGDLAGGGTKPELLTCNGKDEYGRFLCSGMMMHGECVYRFNIAVEESGNLEMLDDCQVANLPRPTVPVELRPQ